MFHYYLLSLISTLSFLYVLLKLFSLSLFHHSHTIPHFSLFSIIFVFFLPSHMHIFYLLLFLSYHVSLLFSFTYLYYVFSLYFFQSSFLLFLPSPTFFPLFIVFNYVSFPLPSLTNILYHIFLQFTCVFISSATTYLHSFPSYHF